MRWFLAILFALLSLKSYAEVAVDSARYAYAKKAPQNINITPLVNYLKKGAANDQKVVETFFYWIALNIKYNNVLRLKPDVTEEDISISSILSKKKTICVGYSKLLQEMCKLAKIECVVVEGFAQTMLDGDTGVPHAWNAVKIGDSWHLVDATWGSGGFGFGNGEYTAKLDIDYFFADPNFLLIDHFPEDVKWQLLSKGITLTEFHNKYWDEMRFRKFNNLLDDAEYREYKEHEKENVPVEVNLVK